MKKSLMLIFIAITVIGFTGTSFAGKSTAAMGDGSITIAGAAPRPDVTNLAISMNSWVTYNTGNATTCQVTSASGKATDEEVLQFLAMGNQTPGETDDSNIYQKALGTTPTDTIDVQDPTATNSWFIRGTGQASTFTGTIPSS